MIESLKITGLKSIAELELDCKQLNIITGTNSSGKSTLLQAILLFFQIDPLMGETIGGLNGRYVSLGDFRENKCFNVTTSKIEIEIKLPVKIFENTSHIFKIQIFEDEKLKLENDLGLIDTDIGNLMLDPYGSIIRKDVIKYLSCHRIGSQDIYSKNYITSDIGFNGEYAINYLEKNKSYPIDQSLIMDTSSETLSAQVNFWLKYIVDAEIITEDIKGTDFVKAFYTIGNGRPSRPRNVGSGISYLISVLILCLASHNEDILIIENPEIHLHPKAQSKLCEFLYFIAASGRQIFVETHSDHIFNGIRAGICE